MAIIGYIRVSTKDQNTDRQRKKLLSLGIEERLIFEDKASGKDFNREQYQFMRNQVLRSGDTLYIDSLDRLGRDYEGIIAEWKHITRTTMADIIVLDQESLFDSQKFKNQGDIGKLLEDNMLALLAYVADSERKKIKQRQKEGIAVARSKGVSLGRKAMTLTNEQKTIFTAWSAGNLKTTDAVKKTGFSKSTFYYFSKKYSYNKKILIKAGYSMKAVLMNKNTPTMEVEIDSVSGRLLAITKKINPEFLPELIRLSNSPQSAFEDWLRHRSISNTRVELQTLLQESGVDTASALSLKNLGLNLSDQYWFKPVESDLSWSQVNFFQNSFISDTSRKNLDEIDVVTYSPNASSNGELYKFWVIKDNERYLYKDSTKPYFQQAANEVFASRLLDILDIPHVEYTLEKFNSKTYSACKTFIQENTEYVPALYILNSVQRNKSDNDFTHFLRCIDKLNIPCSSKDIETILAFDFIINNEDRHYGNFGFIRNAETLQYQGIAPIFDNGNSLWYMSSLRSIKSTYSFSSEKNAKPFKNTHIDQLKLISSGDCIDFSKIKEFDIKKLTHDLFKTNKEFEDNRIQKISSTVWSNIQSLEKTLKKAHDLER